VEVAAPLPFSTTLLAAMEVLVATDSLAQLQPFPTAAIVPVSLMFSIEPGPSRLAVPDAPAPPVAQLPELKPPAPKPPWASAGAEMEVDKMAIANAEKSFIELNSNPPIWGTTDAA
jgi:hypothetical protein